MISRILKKMGLRNEQSHEINPPKDTNYPDFERIHLEIIKDIEDFTMTSPERIFALIEAVKYIINHNIVGDIVECGVWKGGSLMAIIQTLIAVNNDSRKVIGFDTFEKGMTESSDLDISIYGSNGKEIVQDWEKNNEYPTLEFVLKYLLSSGYPARNIKLIKGDIFETLEKEDLKEISLLRLDTDWYNTTKFELEYLYKKVSKGGIIIIDDYGYWKGARKAVDEFISQNNLPILLNRLDDTARLIIKP
jgi:O-methyltransferase